MTYTNISKTFWYCDKHKTCFMSTKAEIDKPNLYDKRYTNCYKYQLCYLKYIGYRLYDLNNKIIKDTTPDKKWFESRDDLYTFNELEYSIEFPIRLKENRIGIY